MSNVFRDWPTEGYFHKLHKPYGIQVIPENWEAIKAFDDCTVISDIRSWQVKVETNEGTLLANRGDWILEDSEGRHYPVEADEMFDTYTPARHITLTFQEWWKKFMDHEDAKRWHSSFEEVFRNVWNEALKWGDPSELPENQEDEDESTHAHR